MTDTPEAMQLPAQPFSNLTRSAVDYDQQGLAIDAQRSNKLKALAKTDPKAASKAVAQEFEQIFMAMMLKSMRDATPQFDEMESQDGDTYRGLLDQQLTLQLSRGKGLGLATALERQLNRLQPVVQPGGSLSDSSLPTSGSTQAGGDLAHTRPVHNDPLRPYRFALPESAAAQPAAVAAQAGGSPEAFLARIGPAAQAAGRALGVSPHLLLAHAALETGWGKKPLLDAQGGDSHNLFGIKAGSAWQGRAISSATTEVIGGVAQRQVEPFRAYDNYQHAFNDYAQLLYSRYSTVLGQGDNAHGFASALARGGYATDPDYAQKLVDVAQHPRLAAWREGGGASSIRLAGR